MSAMPREAEYVRPNTAMPALDKLARVSSKRWSFRQRIILTPLTVVPMMLLGPKIELVHAHQDFDTKIPDSKIAGKDERLPFLAVVQQTH